jgi:hypothetical protein
LEDDGIDACALQGVELCGEGLLHGFSRHADELSVDGLYPCSAKLAFGELLVLSYNCATC